VRIADPDRYETTSGRDNHQSARQAKGSDHRGFDPKAPSILRQEPCGADRESACESQMWGVSDEDIERVEHLDESAERQGDSEEKQIRLEATGPDRAGSVRDAKG